MMEENLEVSPRGHKLEPIIVGKIRGSFWVPGYQRGYRWSVEDVQRLLDDIWNCNGRLYNLQPVVVKLHRRGADETSNEWELIDGQQRLTTLYLIMQYMKVKEWKKLGAAYSIQYATRPGSHDYLTSLAPELASKNIDYFHLYQAFQVIDKWFQSHGDAYVQEDVVTRFHGYLTEAYLLLQCAWQPFFGCNVFRDKAQAKQIANEFICSIGRPARHVEEFPEILFGKKRTI